ncbi:MAG: response regulator [Sphingobacteriaceae bacterium]|nr:MAG: response regulator [Sphingobacteriaceae bacterium]
MKAQLFTLRYLQNNMPQNTNVIIIDDSKEDCYLINKRLQTVGSTVNVVSFFSAQEAYNHIVSTSLDLSKKTAKNIIILDIYMPLMDGFEFLEEFEKLPLNIQNQYTICALTSSISKSNMEKITSYKSVKSFLEKPIKTESLLQLIEN